MRFRSLNLMYVIPYATKTLANFSVFIFGTLPLYLRIRGLLYNVHRLADVSKLHIKRGFKMNIIALL